MAIEERRRGGRETSQSVDRATAILRSLALNGPLRLADLTRLIGAERRVLQRLLASLENAGLVQRDPNTLRYDLGVTISILGRLADERVDLVRVAPPFLQRLLDATGHTALLLVRQGDLAVSAHVVEPPGEKSVLTFPVGRSIPLWRSVPKVILAHLPAAERAEVLARNGHGDLGAELDEIAASGYAIGRGEVLPGGAAVGAAVFDAIRRPVAALAALGSLDAFEPEEAARAVVETANDLSRALGHGSPAAP